jgi:transcriptional regulator with XRE-family HTH domain
MNNFSARLKSLMESQGLTQQELAQRARTSQASIYRYRSKGVLPQPKALLDLAAALNVSPTWLETGKGDKYSTADATKIRPGSPALRQLTADIPPDLGVILADSHHSPFSGHSEREIWDYIATTATAAPTEKPLNQRLYLGNLLAAVQELQRRLPLTTYRQP